MSFLQKFWPGWPQKQAETVFKGSLYAGRQDEFPACPEFLVVTEDIPTSADSYLWAGSGGKVCTRSLMLADKGDACDLALRRIGPDGSKYNDQNNEIVRDGHVIGTIYWQAWGGTVDSLKPRYWTPRDGTNGRCAAIRTRAAGDQTATNRAGRFQIAVTPAGKKDPVDRLEITSSGDLRYNFPGKGWKTLKVDSNGFVKAS